MKKHFKYTSKIVSVVLITVILFSSVIGLPVFAEGTDSLKCIGNCGKVYVGGMPFGIKLYTAGLLVVGFSDVECDSGSKTPAIDAGMRIGDIIIEADGKKILTAEDFTSSLNESSGSLTITYIRDNEKLETTIVPSLATDGRYKTGMWLRDNTAGIGTVTFTVPETLEFAGLGHGICDTETGEILPLMRGIVAEAKISGIKKGEAGTPGELRGYFCGGNEGVILKNTSCGVFGILNETKINELIPEPVELGTSADVHTGKAHIYCTVEGDKPEKYEISILRLPNSKGSSNFEIQVTDPALLEKTGGIVQGMSGSPILQDGKLIGAVTHVMISDPTMGYGIYIEKMIEAAA